MDENNYSKFGQYNISEKLDLQLPKTEIHMTRKEDQRLAYYRKNSINQEIRKSIPQSNQSVQLELCPILPLHLPSKITHDLIFLRLTESIFVEKKSTINFIIQFPIEIGIFIINSKDGSKQLFDCFTCEPMHSRFALYGTSENGKLCMYSKVDLLGNNDVNSYIFAKMKVTMINELDQGVFVKKLVFPITDYTIYYDEKSSEVHIDDIEGVIKLDVHKEIIKISKVDYVSKNKDLKQVSYSSTKDNKPFVMDKGFD